MLSPYALDIRLANKSELVAKHRKRAKEKNRSLPHPVYASLVEAVDHQVGPVVKEVEAQELSDNIMLVFTSDNGGLNKGYDYNGQSDVIVSDLAPLKSEKNLSMKVVFVFPSLLIIQRRSNLEQATLIRPFLMILSHLCGDCRL